MYERGVFGVESRAEKSAREKKTHSRGPKGAPFWFETEPGLAERGWMDEGGRLEAAFSFFFTFFSAPRTSVPLPYFIRVWASSGPFCPSMPDRKLAASQPSLCFPTARLRPKKLLITLIIRSAVRVRFPSPPTRRLYPRRVCRGLFVTWCAAPVPARLPPTVEPRARCRLNPAFRRRTGNTLLTHVSFLFRYIQRSRTRVTDIVKTLHAMHTWKTELFFWRKSKRQRKHAG